VYFSPQLKHETARTNHRSFWLWLRGPNPGTPSAATPLLCLSSYLQPRSGPASENQPGVCPDIRRYG